MVPSLRMSGCVHHLQQLPEKSRQRWTAARRTLRAGNQVVSLLLMGSSRGTGVALAISGSRCSSGESGGVSSDDHIASLEKIADSHQFHHCRKEVTTALRTVIRP